MSLRVRMRGEMRCALLLLQDVPQTTFVEFADTFSGEHVHTVAAVPRDQCHGFTSAVFLPRLALSTFSIP